MSAAARRRRRRGRVASFRDWRRRWGRPVATALLVVGAIVVDLLLRRRGLNPTAVAPLFALAVAALVPLRGGPVAGAAWRWLPGLAAPAAMGLAIAGGPAAGAAAPLLALAMFTPAPWWIGAAIGVLTLQAMAPAFSALTPLELAVRGLGVAFAVLAAWAAEAWRRELRLAEAVRGRDERHHRLLLDDRVTGNVRRLAPAAVEQRAREREQQLVARLQEIVDSARRALSAHGAYLYLRNSDDGLDLWVYDCLRRDLEPTPMLRAGDGMIGWVFKQAEPFLAAEYQKGISGLTHYLDPVDLRSFLGVPIVDTECKGVLAVDSAEIQAFAGEEHRQLLETMAKQVVDGLRDMDQKEETEEELAHLRAFFEAAQELLAMRADERAVSYFLDLVDLVVPADLALVLEEAEEGGWRIVDMRGEYPTGLEPGMLVHPDEGWAGWALAQAAIRDVGDFSRRNLDQPPIALDDGLPREGSAVCLQFETSAELDLRGGGVVLWSQQPHRFGASVLATLARLVAPFQLAWGRARAMQKLYDLATTDGLTRLANRRTALEQLAVELERADRTGLPVSTILLDVDHFKKVNDTHGHAAGDEVLRQVAEALRRVFRSTDLSARFAGDKAKLDHPAAARYGGEEFLIVLPDTDPAAAMIAAERARKAIKAVRAPLDDGGRSG